MIFCPAMGIGVEEKQLKRRKLERARSQNDKEGNKIDKGKIKG
jgi:hypothetical protein